MGWANEKALSSIDRLFLQGMIKHHEGAIGMAQDVATSQNKVVADLSASIIKAQKLEIAAMEELLLKSWFKENSPYKPERVGFRND